MDIYGDGNGFPLIMINPKDKGCIDPEKWKGIQIESDMQEEGSVTFCRGMLNLEQVVVDDNDPLVAHLTFSNRSLKTGTTAKIDGDELVFSFRKSLP